MDANVARAVLLAIVEQAREQRLLSKEHFSVDDTLLESWASLKSFRPKDEEPPSGNGRRYLARNPEVDFREERRKNDTRRSTTNPESRLARKGKGKEVSLCFGALDRVAGGSGSGPWKRVGRVSCPCLSSSL